MRLLAIECATEACSIALFEDGALCDYRHETIGRGHAEMLVPLIAGLPGNGRAEDIRVSLGPGSFTGTRIGIAAARALAIAWGSRVQGYPTLALVAAMARRERGDREVLVAMAGGHGEIYVQPFDAQGEPLALHRSLALDAAARTSNIAMVAGNRAEMLATERNSGEALALLPDARAVPGIPSALLTDHLAPIYGRPPDAKLPAQ